MLLIDIGSQVVAYVDKNNSCISTVRHSECAVQLWSDSSIRCRRCQLFRSSLRALLSRHKRSSQIGPSSKMNNRYMTSRQKHVKLARLQLKQKANSVTIKRLKKKIESMSENARIVVDESSHSDLQAIMKENEHIPSKHPRNSFARLFWEQQAKAASMKSASSMKWHPLMVRWCLYLRHVSGKGYDMLRQTLSLPSQRTLRDYTYFNTTQIGFSTTTDNELLELVGTEKEQHKRVVSIIIDEMYIREQIVYNKHSGHIMGFADMGDINNHLNRYKLLTILMLYTRIL